MVIYLRQKQKRNVQSKKIILIFNEKMRLQYQKQHSELIKIEEHYKIQWNDEDMRLVYVKMMELKEIVAEVINKNESDNEGEKGEMEEINRKVEEIEKESGLDGSRAHRSAYCYPPHMFFFIGMMTNLSPQWTALHAVRLCLGVVHHKSSAHSCMRQPAKFATPQYTEVLGVNT